MMGGASGAADSDCSRKPQSMQEMAPSRSLAPHAGQLEGVPPAAAAGDFWPLPRSGVDGGRLGEAVGADAAGTWKGLVHDGHFTVLPATLSGTCIDFVQCGQRIT